MFPRYWPTATFALLAAATWLSFAPALAAKDKKSKHEKPEDSAGAAGTAVGQRIVFDIEPIEEERAA